jgi:hypothetical protein
MAKKHYYTIWTQEDGFKEVQVKKAQFDGNILPIEEALKRWKAQKLRCHCGDCASDRETYCDSDGTTYWLGCDNPNHSGQFLGRPLTLIVK